MGDLYSEYLVKKKPTALDAVIKYGLIILTVLAALAGLFVSPVILVLAYCTCQFSAYGLL